MTELELVVLAKAGDQDAFEQLVRDNEKRIYNLVLRMVGDPEDALDLSQEAFIKAWKGLPSFKGDSTFSTWIYRLASNTCLDFLRKKKRQQETIGSPSSLDDEDAPPPPSLESDQPEARFEQNERSRALKRGLDALPEHQRQVLILRELSGLSYQEISETLSLDIGTVKSRLTRARLALRKILLEDGNFFPTSSSISTEHKERK